jgi:hypothetical protein
MDRRRDEIARDKCWDLERPEESTEPDAAKSSPERIASAPAPAPELAPTLTRRVTGSRKTRHGVSRDRRPADAGPNRRRESWLHPTHPDAFGAFLSRPTTPTRAPTPTAYVVITLTRGSSVPPRPTLRSGLAAHSRRASPFGLAFSHYCVCRRLGRDARHSEWAGGGSYLAEHGRTDGSRSRARASRPRLRMLRL